MITVWRIARRPYADLAGEGPRRIGGRWTSPGIPAVYLADHPSSAMNEIRVHLDLAPEFHPKDYVLMKVDLPDDPPEVVAVMPSDPRSVGDAWARALSTPVLQVPSAIVPIACNFILNPLHNSAKHAVIREIIDLKFDHRLWTLR